MSNTPEETAPAPQKATTAAAWKKAAVHNILVPSGVRVDIKIPDLPALIEAGTIPQHLLDTALGVARQQAQVEEEPDPAKIKELIAHQREFTDTLTALTVVNPKISVEEAHDLPYEDREMLVAIGTRVRDLDAEGEHIAGLTTSERFRRFRELGEFRPTLEGL
jgi:hypothetical protein